MIKDSFKYFLCSSILLSLAFYFPAYLSFLSLFFLVPILFYFGKGEVLNSGKREVVYFFLSFFIFALIASSWFISIYPLSWAGIDSRLYSALIIFPLWILLCFAFTLPMSFWPNLARGKSFVFAASLWVLIEFIRSYIMVIALYSKGVSLLPHYTYFSVGYTLYNIPFLKELLPVGGLYLATFMVIVINYLIYFLLVKDVKMTAWISAFTLFVIFTANIGMYFIRNSETSIVREVYVGNSKFESSRNDDIIAKKSAIAVKSIQSIQGGDMFILPENIDIYNPFANLGNVFGKDIFAIGSYTNDYEKMYFLDASNDSAGIYQKQILMPIGEYEPLIITLVSKIFGIQRLGLQHVNPGDTPNTFTYNSYVFGGSICSENVSPYIFRNEVRNGANILVNIASHAPFSGSMLLDRHTIVGNTTRALETGRYLVTATNFGESFIITDKGSKLYSALTTNNDEINFSKQKVELMEYKTPYVEYGDYIIYFCFGYILIFYMFRSAPVVK